ncbi:MAG: CpsD/CapB family tyrosine-protein kinase [Caldilineaceae bacterium]|nr:CpsD/CapB family tyrosine-protein kinase [Caldilineaceae bacterium]
MFEKRLQPVPRRNFADSLLADEDIVEFIAGGSDTLYRFPPHLVHSIRHMVTKLNHAQKLPNKVAVVSALRQEGVSFTAQALATIMAHDLSQRICLVDLNWWWPSEAMQKLASHSPGLLPLLQGGITWQNTVVRTNYPNLSVLPAGAIPMAQRPVVARSEALQKLLSTLGQHFEHVILDVPALFGTSDAISLASLADAACVVVQQGATPRPVVKRALTEIEHLPTLGVIMNRVEVATPGWLLKWIPQI